MNKKSAFIVVLITTICFFGFFRYRNTDSERIELLIQKSDYVAARDLLSTTSLSDSVYLLSTRYRLELNDSSATIGTALDYLKAVSTSGIDSVTFCNLFYSTAGRLKQRLSLAESSSLTADLQELSQSVLPIKIKETFSQLLYQRAKKEQTVDAWNNCIVFMGTALGQESEYISQRRKIFLDTLALKRNHISVDSILSQNPCYTPVLTKIDRVHNKAFTFNELFNPDFPRSNYLSSRFIIGDFNSVDAKGNCRGSFDIQADDADIPEFRELIADARKEGIDPYQYENLKLWYDDLAGNQQAKHANALWMWKNYLDKVHAYKTEPLKRDPVVEINGKQYCIGQRMCLCEIRNDTIIMVAQFVTSSRNVNYSHGALRDFDDQPRYYAPRCLITSRYWDRSVPYDSLDIKRDKMMGFASQHAIKYMGRVDLPNFLHMTPTDEFPGAKGYVNGIHEFAVGGNGPAKYMGTPISLGCVRLHDYPSKFVRWWIPKNARFFISYEYKRYIQRL